MTILDKIIAKKREEIKRISNQSVDMVENQSVPSFKELVENSNEMSIIAEIKRASPSKGSINSKIRPVIQAKKYESLGAKAISVLTDETFFQGSMNDLNQVRKEVRLPVLCKDFIIDRLQIDVAKAAGANIILLIVSALDDEALKDLYRYAINLKLEVLVEVHNEEELERALMLKPDIIGINNRNLKTFEVDLAVTERLAKLVTNPNIILVSESGMKTKEDVLRAKDAGVKAILVGETFMRAESLDEQFKAFQVSLKKQ